MTNRNFLAAVVLGSSALILALVVTDL